MMNTSRLLARTVARALTNHLEKADTSIHWVNVVGESSLAETADIEWPHENVMLNLMLVQGNSEGMLVYVMGQANRYRPEDARPVLQIKMLGGLNTVLSELASIWNFLAQVDSLRTFEETDARIENPVTEQEKELFWSTVVPFFGLDESFEYDKHPSKIRASLTSYENSTEGV